MSRADDYTNAGKWDRHYADLNPEHPDHYIDTPTYQAGVDWFTDATTPQDREDREDRGQPVAEDWGCGKGWFAHTASDAPFRVLGIDGSHTPFADIVADLATDAPRDDRGRPEYVYMRGVAEHDYRWEQILINAAAAYTRRACIVFFTPMADTQDHGTATVLDEPSGYGGVPDLSLPRRTVDRILTPGDGGGIAVVTTPSDTAYGVETTYFLWRAGWAPACATCGHPADGDHDSGGDCTCIDADPRPDGEPDQGSVRPCGCYAYRPQLPLTAEEPF